MNIIINSLAKLASWEFISLHLEVPIIKQFEKSIPGLSIEGGRVIISKLKQELKYYLPRIELLYY